MQLSATQIDQKNIHHQEPTTHTQMFDTKRTLVPNAAMPPLQLAGGVKPVFVSCVHKPVARLKTTVWLVQGDAVPSAVSEKPP